MITVTPVSTFPARHGLDNSMVKGCGHQRRQAGETPQPSLSLGPIHVCRPLIYEGPRRDVLE